MNSNTENNMSVQKKVKIAIKSTLFDIEQTDELESTNIYKISDLHKPNPEGQSIRCITDGLLRIDDNRIEIEYDEQEEAGFGQTKTMFCLDTHNPGLVTLARTGDSKSCLVFNSDARRQLCSYALAEGSLSFTVVTREINNSVSADGGKLSLDYELEFNGEKLERNITDIHFMVKA
ncbi:MAG: DUF1934 domain-containing protein [Eubacteriales bacterium]